MRDEQGELCTSRSCFELLKGDDVFLGALARFKQGR